MAGFYIGHGRHWEFFRSAGHTDQDLLALFQEISTAPETETRFQSEDVHLISETGKELSVGLLIHGDRLGSAYPYVESGHTWPIEVAERHEWPSGIEAQLIGSCHGAKIVWFDTRYAENRTTYDAATGPQNFQINGLAYSIWRTTFDSPEHEAEVGGMRAYLPLSDQENYQASDDEIQFMSEVEAAWTVDFHDVPFDVYTITIALPDDFPMRLNLYTPRSMAEDVFTVGERIGGVCWIFGRLAP